MHDVRCWHCDNPKLYGMGCLWGDERAGMRCFVLLGDLALPYGTSLRYPNIFGVWAFCICFDM